jgi:predicted RNA-binding protein with TRAM domain
MYGNRPNFGGQRRGGFSPVQVGQELDVKIEAVGKEGDGIAKEKGFVLFIPGAKEGDEVKVKVTKVLRNVGFAEVVGKADGPVKTEDNAAEEPSSDSQDKPQEEKEENNEDAGEEETSDDSETYEENSQDSEDFGEDEEKKD